MAQVTQRIRARYDNVRVTTISPRLQTLLDGARPGGITGTEVNGLLAEVRTSGDPASTMRAVFARYGDAFTLDGHRALETAATVVGDDQLAAITRAFGVEGQAVAAARNTVRALRTDIATLEQRHSSALSDIQSAVTRIGQRQQELRDARETKRRNGMIFALFGAPSAALVSLVQMMDDDSRLKTLEASKVTAESRKVRAESDAARYRATRDRIESRLSAYEANASKLTRQLASGATDNGSAANIVYARVQLDRRERLLGTLRAQIGLLKELRGHASELDGKLSQMVVELTRMADQAADLVAASKKDLHQLVDIAMSADPDAAAQKWLNGRMTAKRKELLKSLDDRLGGYIDHLVQASLPAGGPAADALRDQLRSRFSDFLG